MKRTLFGLSMILLIFIFLLINILDQYDMALVYSQILFISNTSILAILFSFIYLYIQTTKKCKTKPP